ncbi:DUF4238 domain-containing protein [Sedimentibacter sp. MB31-C6]|uniref:DUF4238 domain-containing protein n=1 Tax=Sedimentibacter sp. MB31-C6 TaxID=3109366 RepID=UPI002DDCAAF9|nr:DUF4238 domain-containing protein [Sedimentibacter sp. MB36-C1]WSI05102.1 DUF4238 domain-containing protein [Sedimentibacter sp. MB36-C1]
MAEYKFQHYVPRTYLEGWENDNQRVHVFMKDIGKNFYKPTKEILGQNDFYTLKSDDVLVLSEDNRVEIFGDLLKYDIILDNKVLEDIFEISMNYFRYDEWIVKSKDGSVVDKECIQTMIEKKRIIDIEKGWHEIEGEWNYLRSKIVKAMDDKSHNLKLEDGQKIITFIASQKSRNVSKKEEYRVLIDSLLSFVKQNMTDNEYNKMIDEFTEAYFLKSVRQYQQHKSESLILKEQNLMMKLHMVFYRATGNKQFMTSDNPAFTIIDNKFYKGNFNGLYFPLTPELLVALYRGETYRYTRADMPANMMRRVNKYIRENANRFYIKFDK